MNIMDTQGATLEINGQVYPLESATYHQNGPLTQTLGNGMTIAYQGGDAWIVAQVQGWDFAGVIAGNTHHRGLLSCVVHLPGASFTGIVWAVDWSKEPPVTTLRIEGLRPIPVKDASPPADSVPEQEIAWHELRSACHRKAWREAWEIVGTDHTGGATPGEVYIFGVARQARAVSAALKAWREVALPAQAIMLRQVETASEVETRSVRRMMARKIGEDAGWQRIKQVAAWESEAAAQHDPEHRRRHARAAARRAVDARITINGREITGYHGASASVVVVDDPVPARSPRPVSTPFRTPGLFGDLAARMSFGDEGNPLDDLREIQRMTQDVRTMPQEIWISPETYAAVQRASIEQSQGIAGVLSNPFMSRVRVVPQAMMPATQPKAPRAQRRRRK